MRYLTILGNNIHFVLQITLYICILYSQQLTKYFPINYLISFELFHNLIRLVGDNNYLYFVGRDISKILKTDHTFYGGAFLVGDNLLYCLTYIELHVF